MPTEEDHMDDVLEQGNPGGESEELSNDILTLLDDDGREHQFEKVDEAEFEGADYYALIPMFDTPEEQLDDRGELVILKVVEDEGEQFLEAIEDEAEFKRIGDFFVQRLEEYFDFED